MTLDLFWTELTNLRNMVLSWALCVLSSKMSSHWQPSICLKSPVWGLLMSLKLFKKASFYFLFSMFVFKKKESTAAGALWVLV